MGIWETNLASLRDYQPVLADAVAAHPSLGPFVEATPDGGATVRIGGDKGAWVHSRRAPIREIDRLINDIEPAPFQPIVLVGVGLGDALERLLRAHDRTEICVLEHNLGLIRAAMERFDFSKAMDERRLAFACDLPGQTPRMVFTAALHAMPMFGRATVTHGYTGSDPGYLELLRELRIHTGQKELEVRSEANGARLNLENVFGNLGVHLESAPLKKFSSVFAGVPGVLVCAGPSLQRNIGVLSQYSGRVAVLAVSSALRRTMQAGVEVHATNVVDYSHLSQRYFRDLPGKAPPLFAHPRCNSSVLESYSGEVVTCDDELISAMNIKGVEPHGVLPHGGNNVSHYGYQILRALGCNPVIICGLDLAYSFHFTHIAGSAVHDEWAASAGRLSSLEFQQIMFLTAGLSDKFAVKDPYGAKIFTDELLESAGLHFEEFLARERVANPEWVTLNCTEGGRVLDGVENRSLAEALAEHALPGRVNLEGMNSLLDSAHSGALARLRAGLAEMRALERSLRELTPLLDSALSVIEGALKRMDAGDVKEFHDRAFDRLADFIEARRGMAALIRTINAGDRISRRILDSKLADDRIDEKERLRLLAEREKQWISAIAANRQYLADLAARCAEGLEKRIARHAGAEVKVGT